jgi:bifunctional DNase/RNase
MVEMELIGVRLEVAADIPVLLHQVEARAIQFGIDQLETPRPLTHDLFVNVLEALGARLQRLLITELRESPSGGTFFAELDLLTPTGPVRVSSRPSDGVALAVRAGVPILADESVLERAATPVIAEEDGADEEIVDQFREFLDDVNPEDFAS